MAGIFITFEGIEGCGKSTQAELLKGYLEKEGHDVIHTREPGGTPVAECIRTILLDPANKQMTPETELLLYMAARHQHTTELLLPTLESGKIVICDRYFDSTFAYQGAARKIDDKIVRYFNQYASLKLVPDLTIILDIPVDLSRYRMFKKTLDRIESESLEFHNTVRENFQNLPNVYDRCVLLNGRGAINDIHNEVIKVVNEKLEELTHVKDDQSQ